MPAPIAAIFGPTAAGKSELALAVAERAGGEIVSADAMQLYRGLPTLTAQPGPEQLARVPHHLVGIWGLDEAGSLGIYAPLAHAAIDAAPLAVVAGGTGLYLRAALADLRLPPQVAAEVRERCAALYDELGAEGAHAELARRDPAAARAVHANDRRRIVRALELNTVGASLAPREDRLWSEELRRPARIFTVEWERPALHERIEARTRAMLAGDALEEVRAALAGPPLSHTAARILGLAEAAACVRGELSVEEARERIALRTRQYARRQEVWMRKIPDRIPLRGADGPERNAARILESLS